MTARIFRRLYGFQFSYWIGFEFSKKSYLLLIKVNIYSYDLRPKELFNNKFITFYLKN